MIEAYVWTTPNAQKALIALEERAPPQAFLAINPNHKIPAIVDPEGPDGQPISVSPGA
ncbi:MAG: hypothetical protein WKG01_08535 [Kofleriaceae bacterium]